MKWIREPLVHFTDEPQGQRQVAESGQAVPGDPAGLARVILDSLALRYASVLDLLEELTGRAIPGVHECTP